MRLSALAGALVALAGAGAAQEVPRFDADRGYRVIGVLQGDRVVVENGPDVFVCELASEANGTRFTLRGCAPILAEADPRPGGQGSDADFLRALNGLSDRALEAAIREVFVAQNCSAVLRGQQFRAFEASLARSVAARIGFDAPVSPARETQIIDQVAPVLDWMVENQRVSFSQATGTARLIACHR